MHKGQLIARTSLQAALDVSDAAACTMASSAVMSVTPVIDTLYRVYNGAMVPGPLWLSDA